MMPKAIVLLSGGLDSTTCMAIAQQSYEVYCLHLNYGQLTEDRELEAFRIISDYYMVPVQGERRLVVDAKHLSQIGGSSLTDKSIQVPDADLNSKEIPSSYVSFRNAHILAIAVSWAEVIGAEKIFIGAVAEDSSEYPDCRPEFYQAFNALIEVGTKPKTHIEIVTPIIHLKKWQIIIKAIDLKAPIGLTWSCYRYTGDKACGTCDSCAIRLRGFREAGIPDPIHYKDEGVRLLY